MSQCKSLITADISGLGGTSAGGAGAGAGAAEALPSVPAGDDGAAAGGVAGAGGDEEISAGVGTSASRSFRRVLFGVASINSTILRTPSDTGVSSISR